MLMNYSSEDGGVFRRILAGDGFLGEITESKGLNQAFSFRGPIHVFLGNAIRIVGRKLDGDTVVDVGPFGMVGRCFGI